MEYEDQETTFSCGEGLFLYTDGLTEAENVRHQLFGTEKMLETVLAADGKPAGELVDAMKDAVKSYTQGCEPSDDLTMLAVRYTNPSLSDSWERRVTLHDVSEIPKLQRFMQAVSEHADLDHALSLNLNLALEEAVSNVLLYAYPDAADKKVDIKAVVLEDRVDFTVSDSGVPFDPTAKADPDLSADLKDRPIGGLGIFLVKRIMDAVSYRREDGKNILSMTKKR
jgi:sigma-B regulation protein RsbU (phosphoserine phosphatase)